MAKDLVVYLYVWSGDAHQARALVAARYPGVELREFPHSRMRQATFAQRLRVLQNFRGRAIVFYFASLADLRYRQMMACIQLLHHCHETVLCDGSGSWQSMDSIAAFKSAPGILLSLLRDGVTFAFWWLYLLLRLPPAAPVGFPAKAGDLPIAYLLPSPASIGLAGGAISHIRGFLSGLKVLGKPCRVFTGTPLAQDVFANEIIPKPDRPYFFWEAVLLSYNFTFARGVQRGLAANLPHAFYQRHGRFSIAGALLSRRLNVPLILEYNGSEAWMAHHWDPTPFPTLVSRCEQLTLRSAARIVVVSQVLKTQLLQRGFPADRIRVNPNGVDGNYFYPGPRREAGRAALQVDSDEVLVGFVGSFSLWHGIEILRQAIICLLSDRQPCRLRFVLIGDGLLQGEMRAKLAAHQQTGEVIFTGSLPPDQVAVYLDAADILVSPHIPMPDGSRFFGSPTKLFEYMAMGKAIVASRLDQLAEVLAHDQTAWLVTPGDVQELAQAIRRLAADPAKRSALGAAARRAALQRHSWNQNVAIALEEAADSTIRLVPTRAAHEVSRSAGYTS